MTHASTRVSTVMLAGLLFSLGLVGQQPTPGQTTPVPIARFSTGDFWLNLHQFLYVLGRAETKAPDASRRAVARAPADQEAGLATMSASEQVVWRDAVSAYAGGLSKLDTVFDEPLVRIANLLAASGSAALVGAGLDPATQQTLERAAPLYRRVWWPSHHTANDQWAQATQALLDRHGASVLAFIVRAYQLPWPATGYPVHVAGYSNWAGAFSTSGRLLIISSLDSGNAGAAGLETMFHEAMHQWDDPIAEALTASARAQGKRVPPGLSHAMIFFTAGEAVRRTIPRYVPYAEANGIWTRGLASMKPAIDAAWLPYLNGQGTRDAALAELIRLTSRSPGLFVAQGGHRVDRGGPARRNPAREEGDRE